MIAADSAGRYRRPRIAAVPTAAPAAQNASSEENRHGLYGSSQGAKEQTGTERIHGANRINSGGRTLEADAEFGGENSAGPTDPHDLNPTSGADELLPPEKNVGDENGVEKGKEDKEAVPDKTVGKMLKSKSAATDSTADAQSNSQEKPEDPQAVAQEKTEKERRQKREKELHEQQRRAWEEAHRPTAWQLQNPSGLQNRDPSLRQRGYVAPNTYFGPQFRAWNNQSPPIAVRELPPNRTMVPPVTRTNVMLAPNTYYGSGNSRWNQISPGRATINPLGGWNMSPGW